LDGIDPVPVGNSGDCPGVIQIDRPRDAYLWRLGCEEPPPIRKCIEVNRIDNLPQTKVEEELGLIVRGKCWRKCRRIFRVYELWETLFECLPRYD